MLTPRQHMLGVALFCCSFAAVFLFLLERHVLGPQPAAALSPVLFTAEHGALAPVQTLRVLFVGDMFFDRQIRVVGSAKGPDYPFGCIDPVLAQADFVIGNLEGPITMNSSVSVGTVPGSANNYRFTFPTTTATTLARHNIRAVSLGNNHILNFGYSGLVSTQQYLTRAGVGYFGGAEGNEPVYQVDQNGVHLSFIGYNMFGGASPQKVAQTITQEKSMGREVIVFAHWGTEYSTTTTQTRPIAELFAKSGATAIVGAHPHVVGVHEMIGTTPVYYSLGNFIFDQYFSKEVTRGLALMMTFDAKGIAGIEEYPVHIERSGQTCLNSQ